MRNLKVFNIHSFFIPNADIDMAVEWEGEEV